MIHIDTKKEVLDFSQYELTEWNYVKINPHKSARTSSLKEEVYVIDNLFPEWFIDYVHDHTIHAPAWLFGRTSQSNDKNDHWDEELNSDGFVREVPAFSQQIFPPNAANAGDSCFKMIYEAFSKSLPDHDLHEIVVNGQQHFHNTIFHRDSMDEKYCTVIYYVNKDWQESWGGETIVRTSDENVKVLPIPGRVVLFKGKLPHMGCSYNECYDGLRATVAFKLVLK